MFVVGRRFRHAAPPPLPMPKPRPRAVGRPTHSPYARMELDENQLRRQQQRRRRRRRPHAFEANAGRRRRRCCCYLLLPTVRITIVGRSVWAIRMRTNSAPVTPPLSPRFRRRKDEWTALPELRPRADPGQDFKADSMSREQSSARRRVVSNAAPRSGSLNNLCQRRTDPLRGFDSGRQRSLVSLRRRAASPSNGRDRVPSANAPCGWQAAAVFTAAYRADY